MKQFSLAAAASIALALGACRQAPAENNVIDHDAASPTASSTLPPDPATQPDANVMAAENAAAAATGATSPAVATAIPAAFQGRWGMVPADCTSTKGDAKGLIMVGADRIRFYESTGKLTSVATNDPDHFVGNFDFAGEGQTWKRSEDLKLSGKMLVRTDDESSAKYTRCM